MDIPIDLAAAWVTLKLALVTSTCVALVGVPISYWITSSVSRWRDLVRVILCLPLVLPPTVLGFYLLCTLTSLRETFENLGMPTPNLAFSFEGLVLGSFFYSLPFALQSFVQGFLHVKREWVQQSYTLGVSPFQTFLKLTLPLGFPSILNGIVLSFAHTLGEFGVVLMLGGGIPGVTKTLSVSLYDQVQAMKMGAAHLNAALLLLSSIVLLSASSWLVPLRRNDP